MSKFRRRVLTAALTEKNINLVRYPNVDLENMSKTVYLRGISQFNCASGYTNKTVYGIEFYVNDAVNKQIDINIVEVSGSTCTETIIKSIVISQNGIQKVLFDSPIVLSGNRYISTSSHDSSQGIFYYNSKFYPSGTYVANENGCCFHAEYDTGVRWRWAFYKAPIGVLLCYLLKE